MNEHAKAQPVRSLEGRYYTDPQIFQVEQKGLLASTWQFAGHASLVKNPGDYFTFSIAGENLFCIKGRDGEIRTFGGDLRHHGALT